MALVHAGRGQLAIELVPVEALDVSGCELREPYPSEEGYDMPPAENLVANEGALSDGAAHGVVKPPLKVLAHGLVFHVEDQTLVPFGHGLRQLLRRLRPRFAVDGLALRFRSRLDRVAGHVKPSLLVEADAPLAVAPLLFRHRLCFLLGEPS